MSEAVVFLGIFVMICILAAIGIYNNCLRPEKNYPGREGHGRHSAVERLNQRGITVLDLAFIISFVLLALIVGLTIGQKADQLSNKHPVHVTK